MARKAKSLDTLLNQINTRWQNRSKATDGWLGDAAHQRRKSDHNPNAAGVVRAIDVTHDPAKGCDAQKLADELLASQDPRIKYVIHNRRIFSSPVFSDKKPWSWRAYTGHPHDRHVHISVNEAAELYDDPRAWSLPMLGGAVELSRPGSPGPVARPEPGLADTSWHQAFADAVIDWEAKKKSGGRIDVHLPGDGSYEVAGINSRHHPNWAAALRELVYRGDDADVRREASRFIIQYTDPVRVDWGVTNPGVELFLRDTYFNRGPAGAAKVLQMALGFQGNDVDGVVGRKTREALGTSDRINANGLQALRDARERYEDAEHGPRPQYRKGLRARWDKALAMAKAAQSSQPTEPAVPTDPTTPVVLPEPKPELSSRTIWMNILGAVLSPLFGYLAAKGFNLSTETQLYITGGVYTAFAGLSALFHSRSNAPVIGSPLANQITAAKEQGVVREQELKREIVEAEQRMPPGMEQQVGQYAQELPDEKLLDRVNRTTMEELDEPDTDTAWEKLGFRLGRWRKVEPASPVEIAATASPSPLRPAPEGPQRQPTSPPEYRPVGAARVYPDDRGS